METRPIPAMGNLCANLRFRADRLFQLSSLTKEDDPRRKVTIGCRIIRSLRCMHPLWVACLRVITRQIIDTLYLLPAVCWRCCAEHRFFLARHQSSHAHRPAGEMSTYH